MEADHISYDRCPCHLHRSPRVGRPAKGCCASGCRSRGYRSTGYGHTGLNRGRPTLADVVWREVEALADHVLRRKTLDSNRTALLGASFGGFMTNWIVGHTTRFKAIVTHAGLYALDQQHPHY